MRLVAYRSLLDQLATLLESGIPILESLSSLETGPHRQTSAVAGRLRRRLEKGAALGEAMAAEPRDFPRAHAALVQAAEKAGAVPAALERLRAEVDRRISAWRALAARSAYPLAVLILTALVVPLFLIFQGRLGAYLALEASIFLPVAGAAALAWNFRARATALARRIPFVAGPLERAALGESLSLLGLLVEAGIGVREALDLAAEAARAPQLAAELRQAGRALEGGRNLSEALGHLRGIPDVERGTIASGERAGAMDRALQSAGKSLTEAAHRSLGRLLIVLTGALYGLAALTVGLIYLSYMLSYLGRFDGLQ